MVYQTLTHPNLCKLIDYGKDTVYTKKDGQTIPVAGYIVIEYAPEGVLFDYVSLECFSEDVCRYYFKQMLSTLSHLHLNGLAHCGLSLENSS